MSSPNWHTRRSALRALTLSLVVGLLGACATSGGAVELEQPSEYRLGPGDQLRITVFGEAELTGLFQVGSQGVIAYPLVGDVQGQGLTVIEFTERLQTALQAFIRQPNVSVEVANYRPFFILGEVQRPGTYPYSANLTVQNAVATAGGFTYRANRGRVYIRHANEPAEHAYPLTITTPVLPGDTVRIGERLF
jgi:polysaccharide export outer membrane protein